MLERVRPGFLLLETGALGRKERRACKGRTTSAMAREERLKSFRDKQETGEKGTDDNTERAGKNLEKPPHPKPQKKKKKKKQRKKKKKKQKPTKPTPKPKKKKKKKKKKPEKRKLPNPKKKAQKTTPKTQGYPKQNNHPTHQPKKNKKTNQTPPTKTTKEPKPKKKKNKKKTKGGKLKEDLNYLEPLDKIVSARRAHQLPHPLKGLIWVS